MNKKIMLIISVLSVTGLVSCSDSSTGSDEKEKTSLEVKTYSNLDADAQTVKTGKYTLFNFATGSLVSNADSATGKWDIGFKSTTIIVNGGTSGPGSVSAKIVSGVFDELTTAPTEGFVSDAAGSYAIPTGSGNGWYNYNGATMIITPIAGKILVFKTADSKYVKMEILSYYKDAPANPDISSPSRYYTFRYVYQSDGSINFK